ncbi:MAG: Holliday junction branch migration protein RuvA [Eubacteriales bacterium]|jgi:Holliday junction DNA helicase RuvA
MFEYIKGTVTGSGENYLVLETGGIGYRIFTTQPTIQRMQVGREAVIYTHLYVREDVLDLYGMDNREEMGSFRMLLSVSGVGPKMALSILSELPGEKVALAVVTDDTKALTRANGVGPKLAKRILLELKDKIKNQDLQVESSGETGDFLPAQDARQEAVNALMVLGYSRGEAQEALRGLDVAQMTLEECIKAALKKMMK